MSYYMGKVTFTTLAIGIATCPPPFFEQSVLAKPGYNTDRWLVHFSFVKKKSLDINYKNIYFIGLQLFTELGFSKILHEI